MIHVSRIQIPGMETQTPRRLYVYLPPAYGNSGLRYPVLYMFDGHNVFYDSHATYGKSWGMKEYLARSRQPVILVAVECNPEGHRRLSEYAPWDFSRPEVGPIQAMGRQTMEWLTGVLKPEIDRRYRTLPDRDHCWIAGNSMGGLMSLYAVTAWNGTFFRAAALSPSLWAGGSQLSALIQAARFAQPTRIYLDTGTGEQPPEQHRDMAGLFETAALLTAAGAEVSAQLVPGALHNEAAWERRIPTFFDYLGPLVPEPQTKEAGT